MRVLGISCYFHDAAACLLEDGKLIAAAEEERFTRIKHDPRFPRHAIRFCLEQGGIEGPELDYVVFFEKPFVKFERLMMTAVSGFPKTYMQFVHGMRSWLFDKLWIRSHIDERLGHRQEPHPVFRSPCIPCRKCLFLLSIRQSRHTYLRRRGRVGDCDDRHR